jgi:hypothetical protein
VPEHAFLTEESYGDGWRCERGYRARAGACVVVDLPANAHLSSSGDSWNCDPPYRRGGDVCVSE